MAAIRFPPYEVPASVNEEWNALHLQICGSAEEAPPRTKRRRLASAIGAIGKRVRRKKADPTPPEE